MAARYITPEGHADLKAEFERLWRRERPEVTRALSAAAAEGDRSENAEYIYRKKQLREMDRRIRYLSKRLDVLTVVSETPRNTDQVFFGAWVELKDDADATVCYRIVGPDEIDPKRGWISIDSPLARALLKHQIGDDVTVTVPKGETWYEIVSVRYGADG